MKARRELHAALVKLPEGPVPLRALPFSGDVAAMKCRASNG